VEVSAEEMKALLAGQVSAEIIVTGADAGHDHRSVSDSDRARCLPRGLFARNVCRPSQLLLDEHGQAYKY
jgi:hypothetical protein